VVSAADPYGCNLSFFFFVRNWDVLSLSTRASFLRVLNGLRLIFVLTLVSTRYFHFVPRTVRNRDRTGTKAKDRTEQLSLSLSLCCSAVTVLCSEYSANLMTMLWPGRPRNRGSVPGKCMRLLSYPQFPDWGPPSLLSDTYRERSGRSAKLTTHVRLEAEFRMREAKSARPPYSLLDKQRDSFRLCLLFARESVA
jgi:hypothetical protein